MSGIAIIGPGGVGLGLGSCLLAAGERVVFVAREATRARALETHGLVRTGIFGERRFAPDAFEVAVGLEALRGRALDWILVCTKAHAARELAPALAAEVAAIAAGGKQAPRVVLCVNGWGTAECFAEHMPPESIFNARVITGFALRGAHAVEITVHAEAVRIGSLYGASAEQAAPLAARIAEGGVPCEASPTIAADLWAKMLYNCALNPLGALIGVPYGTLGERSETRSIIAAVVAEIFSVLELTGQRTHWDTPAAYLDYFWNQLLPPTAAHESSMLQDLRAGRRSEVDALTGAVATLAAGYGASTPVCTALTRLIHAREEHMASLH